MIRTAVNVYVSVKSCTPLFVQESLESIEVAINPRTYVRKGENYLNKVIHTTIDEVEMFFQEMQLERSSWKKTNKKTTNNQTTNNNCNNYYMPDWQEDENGYDSAGGVDYLDNLSNSKGMIAEKSQVWEMGNSKSFENLNSNLNSKPINSNSNSSSTNNNLSNSLEQLSHLKNQEIRLDKKGNTIQERLKYLWLVIIDYAKTCTPEHEQQIIIAFRDNYFKKVLIAIQGVIDNQYTPETLRYSLIQAKAFLDFICDSNNSSMDNKLERKGSIFFIEDEED